MDRTLINLADPVTKRKALTYIGAAQGQCWFELTKFRPRHSDRARAYYFASIVGALRSFFQQQGDNYSVADCHEILKEQCMSAQEVINRTTGEVMGTRRKSIAKMTTDELSAYMEKCIAFLGQSGIEVMPPDTQVIERPRRKAVA